MAKQKDKAKPVKAEKDKGGAPSKYDTQYAEQVYKLCLLGATDADIADFFEVCEKTINNWKKEFPEFLQSITRGKKKADMEIAVSLFEGARDRTITEQQAFKLKTVTFNDKGQREEKEVIEVIELEKVVPGDFRNQQFWLRNRKAESWKDKMEVDQRSNNVNHNTADLSPEEVRAYNKALEDEY